jgi:beta-glucanase (GH16 family)
MSPDQNLTRNYQGILMLISPNATNGVTGTAPGQTLYGKKGTSNWIISPGGGSTLIGGDSGDTFFVVDPTDVVIAAPNSGINTIVSWTSYYVLPANVQNLFLQSASGGIGVGNNLDNLLVAEGPSNYTLVAGTGNDVMIGNGSGDPQFDTGAGSTTFIIAKGDGNDVIANFRSGIDVIRLDGFTNLTDFASLTSAMSQVGSDVVLNLGNNQTLTLRNETLAGFKAGDFMLPAHLTGMTLRFDDEFNTFVSSPTGTQGWMTQGGQYWRTLPSNNELEYYSDSSVGVNPFSDTNGVLTITAAPGANPLGLPYNSGIITTEKSFNFEYGLVEVSAKLPAGDGLWPAIWLLPSSLGWPPEIDIMEMLGSNPNLIYASTHSGSSNISSTLQAYVGDTTQAFHTYGLDWEPDHITWYFDGNAIRTVATPADMHQPMYLLINLAVGGNGSWPGPPTSAAEFPAQMSIGYVRIYASSASTAVSGTAVQAAGPSVTISGDTAVSAGGGGPVISAITISPASGDLGAGATVTLTVSFSAAVTVAGGTPSLALNDGGTARYVSGSGSTALVFSYTVGAGQNTVDLAPAATNALALNGATISDAAGNAAVLTAANGYNPAGTLQVNPTTPRAVQTVVVSGWWNTYDLGSGTFAISGTAGGARITTGDGDQTVTITGTNNQLQTGNGNQTITFNGNNNTVTTGAGSSTIILNGGYETVSVGTTPSGTTTISATGFGEVITSTGPGNITFSGSTGNSTVHLADGDHIVTLGGSGNTVTVGVGTSIIRAGIGQAIVHAGGGSDTIYVSGWNNLLDAGAGMNFLHGGRGNDTFVLNGAGQGLDTIWGFSTTNSDKLDLTRTLANVASQVDLTNVGSYITASTSGGNTTLYVDPTGGHGTPYAFALLEGVSATVQQLVGHGSLIVP